MNSTKDYTYVLRIVTVLLYNKMKKIVIFPKITFKKETKNLKKIRNNNTFLKEDLKII